MGSSSSQGATTNIQPASVPTGGSAGGLLANSTASTGVDVQRRAPLEFDPRILGYHVGEVVSFADGAFWTPARIDLDTALGKIDPDNIANIAVIKGPYSVRYGPGFAFLDIQTNLTPRYRDGFEGHGITSLLYRSNGGTLAGRQYIFGGGSDWGFRIGYDILVGNDYTDGGGGTLPTKYNSQNLDFAIGFDLSECSKLEIKYLRVMQNDVQFPGLLTDLTQLNTDGVVVRYIAEKTACFDKLTLDGWYNTTSFTGDSNQPGKRVPDPSAQRYLVANQPRQPRVSQRVQQYSTRCGHLRQPVELGPPGGNDLGRRQGSPAHPRADLTVVQQQYNEFDSFDFSLPTNFGIPATRSIDPGIFVDGQLPLGEFLMFRAGMRFDAVTTEMLHFGLDADPETYAMTVGADPGSSEQFFLFSAFGTAECKLTEELTLTGGYGFAERPPTLTELYTGGAFFGLIQNGFNAIYGNSDLRPEQLQQIDLGIKANYTRFRGGLNGHFALVHDYITYTTEVNGQSNFTIDIPQMTLPAGPVVGPFNNLQTVLMQHQFKNTGLATLAGFDLYGEYDLWCWLTPFVTTSYVDGRDETISAPLPGIAPMESRLGLRVHDPDKKQALGGGVHGTRGGYPGSLRGSAG